MNKLKFVSEIKKWQKNIVKISSLHLKEIPFKESHEWKYDGVSLSHKTGKFFSVIGVCWNKFGKTIYQPLIKQVEIGTLGFLIRKNKNNLELLIQAKTEPGNTGITQLAPTCQATASNIAQVHHGKKPYFASWFSNKKNVIFSSLQSEQGSRFYHKRNLNILKLVDQSPFLDPFHRWYPVEDLLSLTHEDYLLNTDARSVLVCIPWKILLNREPFTRYQNKFSRELSSSYNLTSKNEIINVKKNLTSSRQKFKPPVICPLNKLSGWKISEKKINKINNGHYQIVQMNISVKGREVASWDQPFIEAIKKNIVKLVCGRIDGILRFLFHLTQEPGLYYKIELTPGQTKTYSKQKIIAKYIQSDEGGRFINEINVYQLIDVGKIENKTPHDYWLTLSEIEILLKKDGVFTNEARSAISILLYWL